MCKDVGQGAGGQFLTFAGPDGSKLGTDFSVSVALAANSVTGYAGICFPQEHFSCSDSNSIGAPRIVSDTCQYSYQACCVVLAIANETGNVTDSR